MVRFSHPARAADERITIWCEPLADGFRLVQALPGGDLSAERFGDRAALYTATVQLQSELPGPGWQPEPRPKARHRATRAAHFSR